MAMIVKSSPSVGSGGSSLDANPLGSIITHANADYPSIDPCYTALDGSVFLKSEYPELMTALDKENNDYYKLEFEGNGILKTYLQYYNGYYVFLGQNEKIIYSTTNPALNIKDWKQTTLSSTPFRLTHDNSGNWAVLCTNGQVYSTTNPNGTWTQRNTPSLVGSPRLIKYVNGYWIVLEGTRYLHYATSITGTWTKVTVNSNTNYQFHDVEFGNGTWAILSAYSTDKIGIYSSTDLSASSWIADTTSLNNKGYSLPTSNNTTSYQNLPFGNLVYFEGEWHLLIDQDKTSTGQRDQHLVILKTLSLSSSISWEKDTYFDGEDGLGIFNSYLYSTYYIYGQMFIHNNELYIIGCNNKRYVKIDSSGNKTLIIREQGSSHNYGTTIDADGKVLSLGIHTANSVDMPDEIVVTNAPQYFQIPYGEENQFIKYKK